MRARMSGVVGAAFVGLSACYSPLTPGHLTAPPRVAHAPRATPDNATDDGTGLVALALRDNPRLRALRARAATARARSEGAGRGSNPELRFTGLTLDDIVGDDIKFEIALRARVGRPGTLDAGRDKAVWLARGIDARVLAGEVAVGASVRRALVGLDAARGSIAALSRLVELTRELRDRQRARMSQGLATQLDVARTDVRLARLEDRRLQVLAERARLRAELEGLLGGRPPVAPRLGEGLPDGRVVASGLTATDDELVARALTRRAEAAAAIAGIGRAGAEAFIERSRNIPWFSFVQVGYESHRSRKTLPIPKKGTHWGVGVGIDIPVFDWASNGADRATALLRQRKAEAEAVAFEITAEVRFSAARLRSAQRRLAHVAGVLLPTARAATRSAEAAVASQALTRSKALQVAIDEAEIALRLVDVQREVEDARVSLEAALGGAEIY